jgi:RimJ/RimL family protein N-acetyltransferase
LELRLKDGRTVSVRPYELTDFETLVEMFDSLTAEALRWGLPPYDRQRLERWVADTKRNIVLVALDGRHVVGVAAILGSTFSSRLKGIGEFLTYVHQDYQGRGLGTFLTKMSIEEAKRKAFHKIQLQVVADNVAGIKAYERAGFVHEGRLKESFYGEDGAYHDEIAMGIIL